MQETVDCEIRVRYAETDQMGIAYYSNYLVWFEVGRSEFCRMRDFSYVELEEKGYRLVVTEAYCKYRSAIRYDDVVVIRTRLKELNKRMLTFSYEVIRKGDGELAAWGESRHLCTDPTGKPKSLPPDFLKRLANQPP